MSWTRLKLLPDKEYLFTHKRRKTFRARFVRIVRAPGSDPSDEYYLECEVTETLALSDGDLCIQAHTVLLRPSMVTVVQDAPPDISPNTPVPLRSESRKAPKMTLRRRLRKLLRVLRPG